MPRPSTTEATLTPPGGFLGQLQAVDGQPVWSPAKAALFSFALHVALDVAHVHSQDLVPTVALCPELQPRVEVAPATDEGTLNVGILQTQRPDVPPRTMTLHSG